jgi:hypothetical protein
LQGDFLGDIKTVTTPVDADVAIFSDRGSTPLASTMKAQTSRGLGFAITLNCSHFVAKIFFFYDSKINWQEFPNFCRRYIGQYLLKEMTFMLEKNRLGAAPKIWFKPEI